MDGKPGQDEVEAAWDRLSALMQRLVLREMKRRRNPGATPAEQLAPQNHDEDTHYHPGA